MTLNFGLPLLALSIEQHMSTAMPNFLSALRPDMLKVLFMFTSLRSIWFAGLAANTITISPLAVRVRHGAAIASGIWRPSSASLLQERTNQTILGIPLTAVSGTLRSSLQGKTN